MSFGIIAAALNIAGVGLKAFATVEAGKAAEEAAERRAEEERIAAQNEELKRREELNRVLSSSKVPVLKFSSAIEFVNGKAQAAFRATEGTSLYILKISPSSIPNDSITY